MENILTDEQKNKVIDLFINSKIKYATIAKEVGISIEQVYEIIYDFCDKNGYGDARRSKKGVVFKEKKENIHLATAIEIENWINENKRLPRLYISGVSGDKDAEKEIKTARKMRYIMINIVSRYENKQLNQIRDKTIREIVRIITELKAKYSHTNMASLEKTKEIEMWCNKKFRRPRQNIKGVKSAKQGEKENEDQKEMRLGIRLKYLNDTVMKEYQDKNIEQITDEQDREIVTIIRNLYSRFSSTNNINLINAQKIQEWCIENGRKPSYKGEESEYRIAYLLNYINNKMLEKYTNIPIKEIKNEQDKEIIRILTDIEEKYGKQIDETDISKVSKEELSKELLALSETRNASENQIRILANYYGVPLEEVGLGKNDENNSLDHEEYE